MRASGSQMFGYGYASCDGVRALRERQHLGEIGPCVRWRGRCTRLTDREVVDDEAGFRKAIDDRSAGVDPAPAQHVHREIVTGGGARDALEAGMIRVPVASRLWRDL